MKTEIDLNPISRDRYNHTRKLVLAPEYGDNTYKVVAKWNDGSDMELYITYEHEIPTDTTSKISIYAIDFDSGPFITRNSIIQGYRVDDIQCDDNFSNVRLILKNK